MQRGDILHANNLTRTIQNSQSELLTEIIGTPSHVSITLPPSGTPQQNPAYSTEAPDQIDAGISTNPNNPVSTVYWNNVGSVAFTPAAGNPGAGTAVGGTGRAMAMMSSDGGSGVSGGPGVVRLTFDEFRTVFNATNSIPDGGAFIATGLTDNNGNLIVFNDSIGTTAGWIITGMGTRNGSTHGVASFIPLTGTTLTTSTAPLGSVTYRYTTPYLPQSADFALGSTITAQSGMHLRRGSVVTTSSGTIVGIDFTPNIGS